MCGGGGTFIQLKRSGGHISKVKEVTVWGGGMFIESKKGMIEFDGKILLCFYCSPPIYFKLDILWTFI